MNLRKRTLPSAALLYPATTLPHQNPEQLPTLDSNFYIRCSTEKNRGKRELVNDNKNKSKKNKKKKRKNSNNNSNTYCYR